MPAICWRLVISRRTAVVLRSQTPLPTAWWCSTTAIYSMAVSHQFLSKTLEQSPSTTPSFQIHRVLQAVLYLPWKANSSAAAGQHLLFLGILRRSILL